MNKKIHNTLNISLLAILILLAYMSGINGGFQHDDYPNIVQNKQVHVNNLNFESIRAASISSRSGLLRRPISMITFAINHYYSGLKPQSFKLFNVFVHIVNSVLVYYLCLYLIEYQKNNYIQINIRLFAFIVASAWSLHPINLTAVLYIVQRMTSLSACFSYLAIILFIIASKNFIKNNTKKGIIYLLFVIICFVFGVFSKENSALIILYLLLVEYYFIRVERKKEINEKIIRLFFLIFLIIPLCMVLIYSIINISWITNSYNALSFNLYERLLTESRVVFNYIYWIILPNNSNLGLFHDDVNVLKSIFDKNVYIYVIFHAITIICLCFMAYNKKYKMISFGICLYYVSHLMESTIFPLKLIFEHRNYFGSFGLLLAVFYSIFTVKKPYIKYAYMFTIMFIILIFIETSLRSFVWADKQRYALVNVKNHPYSAEAHYELGNIYLNSKKKYDISKGEYFLNKSYNLDKKLSAPLFALYYHYQQNNIVNKNDVFEKLSNNLLKQPMHATNIAWLEKIVNCLLDNKCVLNKKNIYVLLDNSLKNNNLNKLPLFNSYLLVMKARLLASLDNDYYEAMKLINKASNISPKDIRFKINMFHLALSRNDFEKASSVINNLEESSLYISNKELKILKDKLKDKLK